MVPMELYNDLKCEVEMLKAEMDILRIEIKRLKATRNVVRLDLEEDYYVKQHGELVYKTDAAKMLNVTRTTVYAWIDRGVLETDSEGRRVTTRSIYRYINQRGGE